MDLNERNINITISAGTIFKAIVIVLLVVLLFAVKDLVLVVLPRLFLPPQLNRL